MQSGRLRYKLTIQQATEAQNAYGEAVPTWATYCVRRADIVTLGGQERVASAQIFGIGSIRFNLRHDSTTKDITNKMRVSWDSRTFDIKDVDRKDERKRDIILTCVEHAE